MTEMLKMAIAGLKALGSRICAYSTPDRGWSKVCDCKYGSRGNGEETGCPELRYAIQAIRERDKLKDVLLGLGVKLGMATLDIETALNKKISVRVSSDK